MTFALLTGFAVVWGWVCSRWIARDWVAAAVAGLLASISFQVLVYIQLGHVDPFALIGLAVGLVPGFLVAGFVVVLARRFHRGT